MRRPLCETHTHTGECLLTLCHINMSCVKMANLPGQHVLTSSMTSAPSSGFTCDGLIGVKVGQIKVLTESDPN